MIPPAFKNLLASEKGLAGGLLIVCATVLVGLGHMPVNEWTSFCELIFATYVAGKTATSIGEKIADRKADGIGTSPSVGGIGTSPSLTGIGTSP